MKVWARLLQVAHWYCERILSSIANRLLRLSLSGDVELDEDAVAGGVSQELECSLFGVEPGYLRLVFKRLSLFFSLLYLRAQIDDLLVEVVLTRVHVVVALASYVYRLKIRLRTDRLETQSLEYLRRLARVKLRGYAVRQREPPWLLRGEMVESNSVLGPFLIPGANREDITIRLHLHQYSQLLPGFGILEVFDRDVIE